MREATCIRIFAGWLAVRECPEPGQKWTPSVGVRAEELVSSGRRLSYRDRFSSHICALAARSPRRGHVRSTHTMPKFDLTAFYRSTRGPIGGHDKGVSGGVAPGEASRYRGDMSVGRRGRFQWQLVLSAAPGAAEASRWNGRPPAGRHGGSNALTLQVPWVRSG